MIGLRCTISSFHRIPGANCRSVPGCRSCTRPGLLGSAAWSRQAAEEYAREPFMDDSLVLLGTLISQLGELTNELGWE
jgi:hypothetical protein